MALGRMGAFDASRQRAEVRDQESRVESKEKRDVDKE